MSNQAKRKKELQPYIYVNPQTNGQARRTNIERRDF
jgi:hypothetical protein